MRASKVNREATALYWLKNLVYLLGTPGYVAAERLRFRGYSLRAHQVDEEILGLIAELRQRDARNVVEIGTARGGTLFLFLRSLSADARVVSVDLPGGAFGGGYPHWKALLFHALARGGQSLKLLRGDSHAETTRDAISTALGGAADFILIDGDHSYEGAKRDFELYRPLLAKQGFLAFHDIVPGLPDKVGGVPRLWSELKAQYPHRELVKDWGQGGYGIGLLFPQAEAH